MWYACNDGARHRRRSFGREPPGDWKPATSLDVTVHPDPVSIVADAEGRISVSFILPASVTAGAYTVVLSGTTASGAPATVNLAPGGCSTAVDLLIAATACAHQLPPFTRNLAGFRGLEALVECVGLLEVGKDGCRQEASETAKICHAKRDFAPRLSTRYAFSPNA